MTMDSDTLRTLRARREQLAQEMWENAKATRDEQLRLIHETYGVTFGTVVRSRDVDYKVYAIQWSCGEKPWLSGSPRRKDGTFGTAHRNLFSAWAVVEAGN